MPGEFWTKGRKIESGVRANGGLHQGGSKENEEKWSDCGYYNVEETGHLNRLGMGRWGK